MQFLKGGDVIRWDLLTHLIYFDTSVLDADGAFVPPAPAEVATIARLRREALAHGKTLVYGLAGGFSSFKPMLADPVKRAAFIEGVAAMVADLELAGVDFDIEYPVTSADFALMDTFYRQVRTRLGPQPLVSADVAHWQVQLDAATINDSLDWVQTMGYYFRSASQSTSDLDRYANAGAARSKLNLGVPFAGKSQNSPTIPWDIGYNTLVAKVTPFDPSVNSVFYKDGDFQFVGVNFHRDKLRVAADSGGGTMVWHHATDVLDPERSLAVSLHEETARYVAPIDGFELPVGVSANPLYQSGSAAIQGTHARVNGMTGGEATLGFSGSLWSNSRIRSKDSSTGFAFPAGAAIRLDCKVIDPAANVSFYLRLRDAAGNMIQAPSYNVLDSPGWKRIAFGRSAFSANASFNENDIRSYEIYAQYGASGSAFTSRVVFDNLVMISPHPALRPIPDADGDGFTDVLEGQLGSSITDPLSRPDAAFAGLHAWWRMDESTHPVCADAARAIHAMGYGGTTRTLGKTGNAVLLDGVDDHLRMAPAASLTGTGPFTLTAWVKTTDADGGMILQQRDAGTTGYEGQYRLSMTPQGTVGFAVYNGGYQFDFASTATIDDGRWHHVAAVRDGTEGILFIDGTPVARASGPVKALAPLVVAAGCDFRDKITFLNGTLDDVRIYRRALTAADLAAIMAWQPAALADRSVSCDRITETGDTITTLAVTGAAAETSTTYRIVAGDPTGQFDLDPETGVLSLARPIETLVSGSRILTIESVTDGVSSSRSLANLTLTTTLFAKSNNADALNLGSSWTDGVAPGPNDIALWNRTVTAASTAPLGADRSWYGLHIADPAASVTIPAGNTLTLGAGGLRMSDATQDLTIAANLVTGASQTWKVASGRTLLRSGGTTTFNTNTTTTLTGAGTIAFGGAQNLAGTGMLVIDGATLFNNLQSGSMTRSGTTTLDSGVIRIETTVNLFGTGTLELNGGTIGSGNTGARTIGNPMKLGGNPTFGGSDLGNGLLTFTGNADLGGEIRTLTSNLTTGTGTHFTGILSNGGLTKAGSGILTLSGANAFTGATSITAGTLAIGPEALARSSSVDLSGTSPVLTLGANGTTTIQTLSGSNTSSIRSDMTITGTAGARVLTIQQHADRTFAGSIVDDASRPISLVKSGDGTLALTSNGSSFTGDIEVRTGRLDAGTVKSGGVTGSLGAVTGGRTLTIQSGASVRFLPNNVFGGSGKTASSIPNVVVHGGTLETNRFNILGNVTLNGGRLRNSNNTDPVTYDGFQFLGSLTVGGTSASTLETTTGKGNHLLGSGSNVFTVLDATGDAAVDFTVTTTLRDGSNDYPGKGALVKAGPGTMLLAGSHAYTGATSVSAGTLRVTGSLGTGPVTVATGATLGGNGTIGGSLTLASGAIHALELASTPTTQVTRTIGGSLQLQNGNILTLTGPAPQPGTYVLAIATGGIIGTPGAVNLPPGVHGTVKVNGTRLELTVTNPFAAWMAGFSLAPAADISPTGDPDGDGLTNFAEYAFGLRPDSGASHQAVIRPPDRATGTLIYRRRSVSLGGPRFTYEAATSPTGPWTTFTPVSESSDSATPVETITIRLPTDLRASPRGFVRVRASE